MGKPKKALVAVAHPDDEVLWSGGTILMHPEYDWSIYTLCRRTDPDREPRFRKSLDYLRAGGEMGNLNDEPEQIALPTLIVAEAIHTLVPAGHYDWVLTHSPRGEYTRHRRHEEVGRAVLNLWEKGILDAKEIWLFAYEDGQGAYLPRPIPDADIITPLPESIWQAKFRLITSIYGFALESYEARTTPRTEAFWRIGSASEVKLWLTEKEAQR
ncbi:MAG: PIG-L deacetylase family protein [Candidatus Neomarinimicrobiota bacterium]